MKAGLPYDQAEGKVLRVARGSEPLAIATLRMAIARSRKQEAALREALNTPTQCDPLGWVISQLLRRDYFDGDPQHPSPEAAEFWKALGLASQLFS